MFQGIYTPIITLFDEAGIAYPEEKRLVNRLIDADIDGILFCGSIGEFHAMSMQQKKELLSWAVDLVDGRAKVMAGTGGNCVADVVEMTEYARSIGFDAAVVISPFYFQLDEASLYRYYAAVAEVGLPIILYNFPQRTGISLSADLVCRLASDFPSIVGIKDTVDTISHTREIISSVKRIRPDFSVLSGYDEYLIPNLMSGGDGILTGLTNVAPDLFVSLRHAYMNGDLDKIRDQQLTVNKLMPIYTVTDHFISSIKSAVDLVVGDIPAGLMTPGVSANELEKQKIREILNESGILS